MTDVKAKVEGPKIHQHEIQEALATCVFEVDQREGRTATHIHVYDQQGYYLASGFSACVDPANFDAEKGKNLALQDALGKAEGKLWQLEGYHLKKELEAGRYILTQEDKQRPHHVQQLIKARNDLMRNFSMQGAFIEAGCPGLEDAAQIDLLREELAPMLALVKQFDKRLASYGLS